MGIFNREPKINTELWCQEYFLYEILREGTDCKTVCEASFEKAYMEIVSCDSSFKLVDNSTFIKEMTALKIELFNLAWSNFFQELSKIRRGISDNNLCKETILTKTLLRERGKENIWNNMAYYNKTIGQCAEEKAQWLHNLRRSWVEGLKRLTDDLECIERSANVLGSLGCWESGILSQKLTLAVIERLGCQLNLKAGFKLQKEIIDLYNSAMIFIENAYEFGSYEIFTKEMNAGRGRLKAYLARQRKRDTGKMNKSQT